jgi:hypothetical protein
MKSKKSVVSPRLHSAVRRKSKKRLDPSRPGPAQAWWQSYSTVYREKIQLLTLLGYTGQGLLIFSSRPWYALSRHVKRAVKDHFHKNKTLVALK